ncbi:MAG: protein kinase [Gemmataceae bacterium]
MSFAASRDLQATLKENHLLDPDHLSRLTPDMLHRFPEPKALARELVTRGWLTSFQVNRLFSGQLKELKLGPYVLLERLGEGGMGVVFKARHVTLNRTVALKLIRKERLQNPNSVRRFQREVQAAASLSHPNIVMAYNAEEIDGNQLLVMEYIDGTDLAGLIKQFGPLPVAQACDYMRQTALGLQHAHERGLVHRDIKPHNLLLAAPSSASPDLSSTNRQVKILDMGLAKLNEENGAMFTTMTSDGAVMGSPDYMAPEQARDPHLVDIRADLYSLGCTFYQMLTGRVPFPAGTLMQKLTKHATETPAAVESMRSEVPAGVAAIVRKLMAKNAEERYQTPAELAQALEPFCKTSAPTARGESAANSSVENIFQLLAKSRLLLPHELQLVKQRWIELGHTELDAQQFCKWLVDQQYLTEYQALSLLRGRIGHFFINEYKLLDRIGVGKMAGVYRAIHRLGQTVAIKVLPPSKVKDPVAFGRFQREARLALRLNHGNVVRSLQMGSYHDLHYIVMEHLEGETLEEILKQRTKLPPTEAATIVYQALLGLQHLYVSGIVHRDLNPSNLMVLADASPSSPPLVKILDVGLGRAMFQEIDEEVDANVEEDLTKVGTVLGAPPYMAPEQGVDAHASDTRSDLYSLGCILYHTLTGQPPFVEKNVLKLIVLHTKEKPRPLRDFDPALPEDLQQFLDIMLAKDPAQRYQTPEQAAEVLGSYLRSQTASLQIPESPALLPSYRTWLDSTAALEDSAPELETVAFSDAKQATDPRAVTDSDLPMAIPVSPPSQNRIVHYFWKSLWLCLAALRWSARTAMRLLDKAQEWIARRSQSS